jgi:phytoene dehydrogenase-like protein
VSQRYDAVVIGGGHNGLTAAFYLARAGKSVVVLERRGIVGGACVTEEFHPGFRNSSCAFVMSYLRPEVIADMELERRGLKATGMRGGFHPLGDGRHMLFTGDRAHDDAEIGKFSNRDAAGLARLRGVLTGLADFMAQYVMKPPPALDAQALRDKLAWLGFGWDLSKLEPELRHRLMLILTGSVTGFLASYLESEEAMLPLALSATSGSPLDIDGPATALRLVQNRLGQFDGVRGAWGLPMGGMGTITQLMARAVRDKGGEIRVDAPVGQILVEAGEAKGVRLMSGEEIRASVVLSNADPKRTFLKLVPSGALDDQFVADIEQYRCESQSFRMNLALSELPDFACLRGREPGPQHTGSIHICPSLDYLRQAYRDARQGMWSRRPVIDAMIPSLFDDSLAPEGRHVMTVNARFHPRHLSNGQSWHDVKDEAADHLIETLNDHAPNFRRSVIGRLVLSPADLEEEYGLTGGDNFHGQILPSQIFHMRPHPRASGYRTPLPNLYLCGSGAHPGGGVSGAPGHNAAQVVLGDLKGKSRLLWSVLL